jgi:hypothetical protein
MPDIGPIQNGFYLDIENEEPKTTGKTREFAENAEWISQSAIDTIGFGPDSSPGGFKLPSNKGVMGQFLVPAAPKVEPACIHGFCL